MKKLFFILFALFMVQCQEQAINNSSQTDAVAQLQETFSPTLFNGSLSTGYEIDWEQGKSDFSEEFGAYYKFPVTQLRQVIALQNGDQRSNVTLFLIATNYANQPEFYLLKYLENGDTASEEFSLDFFKGFSGLQSLTSSKGELVFAKKITEGIVDGAATRTRILIDKESSDVKFRFPADNCDSFSINHYTDWYQVYGDGSVDYLGSTFEGTTVHTICSDDSGGSSDPPNGGGGGGATYNEHTTKTNDEIDIDRSVLYIPKVKCTLTNLFFPEDQSIFNATILNFSGSNSDFDLRIEVAEVEGNANGILISSNLHNTFTLRIDGSQAEERKPIQIASTFLHEAIHAEMRRYLYGTNNISSLAGFPGTFSDDWDAYVRSQQGDSWTAQISTAEHDAMADKYLNVIISGLREFDGYNLTYDQYFALAIEGLWETDVYEKINSNYNSYTEYKANEQAAIATSSSMCSN